MSELSIKVKISGLQFPLTIQGDEEEMVRKVEAKVRDIERDKAIEASITFPVKDG